MRARRWLRVGAAALALIAVSGCGDSGSDATRPSISRTTTVPSSTEQSPTGSTEPPRTTTTRPPRTTTTRPATSEPATSTTGAATTTAAPPPASQVAAGTTAPAPAPTGEDTSNAWSWVLAVGLLLMVVVVIVLVLRARRRRAAAATWHETSRRVLSQGALVVSELGAGIGAQADREPAFQRRLHELDAGLGSLQSSAPTSVERQAVSEVRSVLAGLQAALGADIALRIGPPAPTPDQLTTSDAVIAQRVRDLDAALDHMDRATADQS